MPLAPQRSRAVSIVRPLLLLLVLTLAWPLFAARVAIAQPTLGGDDRVAWTQPYTTSPEVYGFDIAENGDIYVAMGVEDTITHDATSIRIIRSQDGGQMWFLWATVTDPLPHQIVEGTLRVAEGLQDRIYLAYTLRGTENPSYVRVAYSDLASPSFSFVTVKYDNNNVFETPRLVSDEMNVTAYHMFLAFMGGGGIWFSRSADYGATWDTPYIVGPSSPTGSPWGSYFPDLAYGRNGVLHLVYQYTHGSAGDSTCIHYRRATNYAGSSTDWDPEETLSLSMPGQSFRYPTVAASHGSDKVIVAYDQYRYRFIVGWTFRYPKLRLSTNAGVSWNAADTVGLSSTLDHLRALALPSTGGFRISAWHDTIPGIIEATDANPLSWGSFEQMADRPYNAYYKVIPPYLDYDLSHSNDMGLLWISYNYGAFPDSAIFDGEWRGGPGYPKLEPGFPKDLASSAISPPAMVDVDGDGTYSHEEIVFGDAAGNVQVLDHNGDPLAGWPKDVGTIPTDAPVAISDVDGDGWVELAVGNTAGHVYLFQHDGTLESGWPLDLGTDASVYVSIGGLVSGGGPGHGGIRQIVACSGTQVHVLRSDATEVGIWPQTISGTLLAPAAIGDINDDGVRDVVAVADSVVEAWDAAGRLLTKRVLPGNTLANAPTLADMDLDGDLEIAVPTDSGMVYLMHHNGANVTGWPAGRPPYRTATSVAFADVSGDAVPEVIYGQRDSCIQMRTADGLSASGWPRYTGTGSYYIVYGQPVVAPIDLAGRSVLYGSRNSYAYAWPATGVAPKDGWPREIWDHCNVSPAVGETDGDGHIEVAFTTLGSISIFEFSPYAAALPTQVWPMYAYDPARTGCLACGSDGPLVDVPGGPGTPVALRFAAPRPNPARGVVSLAYDLPRAATVRLTLIDVTGRAVRTLVKAEQGAGTYEARWDGTGANGQALSPGVYFARLSVGDATGEKTLTRKIVRVE